MTISSQFLTGLCSISFRALSVDEIIRMSEREGVEGIEWGSDVHVPVGDTREAQRVAKSCADAGIACPSLGSYVRAGAEDEQQDFSTVLETALALGAANIRVWAGNVPSAKADEALFGRTAERLHLFAALAAASNVTVSLEYHRNTLTDDIESAIALLLTADHPNLFSYWQPEPEIQIADWKTEIDRLGALCSHVHVFHWLPGRVRRPMAEGRAVWAELFADLAEAEGWERPRYAFLEHVKDDDVAYFADDFAILKKLCGA